MYCALNVAVVLGSNTLRTQLWPRVRDNLERALEDAYFLCELAGEACVQESMVILNGAGLDFQQVRIPRP